MPRCKRSETAADALRVHERAYLDSTRYDALYWHLQAAATGHAWASANAARLLEERCAATWLSPLSTAARSLSMCACMRTCKCLSMRPCTARALHTAFTHKPMHPLQGRLAARV